MLVIFVISSIKKSITTQFPLVCYARCYFRVPRCICFSQCHGRPYELC